MQSQLSFIVGAGRSGTTWLWRSLASHPDVLGLPESHIFGIGQVTPATLKPLKRQVLWHVIRGMMTELGLHDGPPPVPPLKEPARSYMNALLEGLDFEAVKKLVQLHETLGEYRSAQQMARDLFSICDGARPMIVEKTPRHALFLDRIHSAFPSSKVIGLVRDGRDVLSSLRARGQDWSNRISDVSKGAEHWLKCNRAMIDRSVHLPQQTLLIRYEDLLRDFHGTLTSVFEFLELDHAPDVVSSIVERNTFQAYTGRKPGDERRGQFNRKGVAGSFLNELSPNDIEAYEALAAPMLQRFGYALTAMALT